MKPANSVQLLQVFNGGKPCGWLGQTPVGFWFHYGSNSPRQNWVCLLMPPNINFYQQEELFPVFAQHLPSKKIELPPLEYLHQHNSNNLGALSFVNPDNPVVKHPIRFTHGDLRPNPGQHVLVSSQPRRPVADTLIHHPSIWPLIETLHTLKMRADPHNRLHALRWVLQTQHTAHFVWYPRPDMDSNQQHVLGLEQIQCVLNLSAVQFIALLSNTGKSFQVLQEVIRTFCKNSAGEIKLLEHLLPLLQKGQLTANITYQACKQNTSPHILGMQYLLNTKS